MKSLGKRSGLVDFGLKLITFALWLGFASRTEGQTIEVLHSFDYTNGAGPGGGMILGVDGKLYGTTSQGGVFGKGTVFRFASDSSFTTLASFNGTNGAGPQAESLRAADGNLYGITGAGGAMNYGTLFRVTTNGSLTTLVSFNVTNGSFPVAGLIQAADGNLYGTTLQGGVSNWGTVFQLKTNGLLATLFSFDLGTNGWQPHGELLQADDGYLYGTTSGGNGTVFQVSTNGELSTLFEFDNSHTGPAPHGSAPYTGLVQGSDGFLYGTTLLGGSNSAGTVFKISTNGTLTTLFSLNPNTAYNLNSLTRVTDGRLYGTSAGGGVFSFGTAFRIESSGQFSRLVSFNATNGGPEYPTGRLVQGPDGNLYGTTSKGGVYHGSGTSDTSYGTIFRIVLPVILTASRSGEAIVLSWPMNAIGFGLQSNDDLNSAANWIDVTNPPAVFGTSFVVTNEISFSPRFYRLKK
jgi:uncharacterized repeat protein (TIGR03803 family)